MAYRLSKGARTLGDITAEDDSDGDTMIDFEEDYISLKTGGSDRISIGNVLTSISTPMSMSADSAGDLMILGLKNGNANATTGSVGISCSLVNDGAVSLESSRIITKKRAGSFVNSGNPSADMEFWLNNAGSLNKVMTLTAAGGMRFGTEVNTGNSGAVLFQGEAPIFRVDSTNTTAKPSFQMHRGATNDDGDFSNALVNGTALGGMQWFGTDSAEYIQGGAILAFADGDWTSSSHPTKIVFYISGDSGAAKSLMVMEANGRVGIKQDGNPNPAYPFHLDANSAGFAAYIGNDGNDSGRYGLRIQCGADDNSGTNYAIQIKDGDGTAQGNVTFSGGTVTYGAFTGDHYVTIEEGLSSHPYGTIMKIVSTSSPTAKSVSYVCSKTSAAKDKAVLGVYSSDFSNFEEEEMQNLHSIFALGDGHVLVCSEGGDIEIGDYICSSNTAGHGMKQDDDLLHNYTVAKASEAVTWASESGATKLIACTYHAA